MTEQQLLEIEGADWRDREVIARKFGVSPGTLDRRAGSPATLVSIKKFIESVPVLLKPYTRILEAIARKGCKLDMGEWHQCETVHCAAGWIVHLAGKEGYDLERRLVSTLSAAKCILRKSRPEAPLPNFYATNEQALAFIMARAKEEMA